MTILRNLGGSSLLQVVGVCAEVNFEMLKPQDEFQFPG